MEWRAEMSLCSVYFFFQAEDGIRDAQESRGLGDVYKRQRQCTGRGRASDLCRRLQHSVERRGDVPNSARLRSCLLYTSDAADDLLCVDLGGRRIIKKKKNKMAYDWHYQLHTLPYAATHKRPALRTHDTYTIN